MLTFQLEMGRGTDTATEKPPLRVHLQKLMPEINTSLDRFSHVQVENSLTRGWPALGLTSVAMRGCTGKKAYTASKRRCTRAVRSCKNNGEVYSTLESTTFRPQRGTLVVSVNMRNSSRRMRNSSFEKTPLLRQPVDGTSVACVRSGR